MFTTLEKVGLVCITVVGFQLVRAIIKVFYINVVGPTMRLNINPRNMGKWAVVTGSTDGVGKAYARALAKLGLDIVLISRNMDKLLAVGAEIEAEFRVNVKLIEADFYDSTAEAYHNIEKEMYGLEIGCLINNVGVSYPHPEYFLELPHGEKIFSNMINCNVIAVTNMTKMLLPQMVERRKGIIVNVSSTAALIPSPLLTVYGATKAYVEKFTKDIHNEYRSRGVTVQCLMPGYVATKMSKIKHGTWMAPTPERYVKSAIDTIGILDVTTGYMPHSMLVWVVKTLESIAPRFAVWVIHQTMENIRRRAIQRYVS